MKPIIGNAFLGSCAILTIGMMVCSRLNGLNNLQLEYLKQKEASLKTKGQ